MVVPLRHTGDRCHSRGIIIARLCHGSDSCLPNVCSLFRVLSAGGGTPDPAGLLIQVPSQFVGGSTLAWAPSQEVFSQNGSHGEEPGLSGS